VFGTSGELTTGEEKGNIAYSGERRSMIWICVRQTMMEAGTPWYITFGDMTTLWVSTQKLSGLILRGTLFAAVLRSARDANIATRKRSPNDFVGFPDILTSRVSIYALFRQS
jgi:hypothetical protein